MLNKEHQISLAQYLLFANGKGSDTPSFLTKYGKALAASLTEILAGDVYLCLEQRRIVAHEQEIALTVKEFDIMFLLIMNPKRVFSYELIMELVWHEDYTYYSLKAADKGY